MKEIIRKILIVDDEDFIRQSFSDYFEDHLWVTYQADSGETALKIIDREIIDAAIVDIRMRGMNGNSFILKAHQQKPEICFVVCTGSPEYDLPEELLNLGCVSSRLFRKPVGNISELENEIINAIKKLNNKAKNG